MPRGIPTFYNPSPRNVSARQRATQPSEKRERGPAARFAAAGVLCKLGFCDKALDVLAEGLEDSRETVALYAAREIQGIGARACPLVPQIKQAQAGCKKPDGSYKNQNHAMFIDWALKYALQNCSR